ncbi:phage integrase family protein [Paraburkholderia xenovorans]
MANRSQTVNHARSYSRNDFAAMRAFVQRVPAATIARLYFTEDEDGNAPTAGWVDAYLRRMQAVLVELALEHGSPVLADYLKASAKAHGSARLTAVSLKMVEQAAGLAVAQPQLDHGVGMWFRPLVAQRLKAENIATLGDLIDFCNGRGGSWWRAVPRIGAGRARLIVAWLRRHEAVLGRRVDADVDLADPLAAPVSERVTIDGGSRALVPLERMTIGHALSGAHGSNRSVAFPYIGAHHDLDAVRAYLYRFRQQPKTLRAYTKELERFLLWSVTVRQKPLSSLLADDCEAYKDFLASPDPAFVGPKAPRKSGRWKPFASAKLGADSQKYAIRALRAAFGWLVSVRYLAGNPWEAVTDPIVVERAEKMKVDRALPASLWQRLRIFIDAQCDPADAAYWRAVRVALLLGGDSGLRREELAKATRERLSPTSFGDANTPIWQLTVIGKRSKERVVPVSPATINALHLHWRDRGLDFSTATSGPLLAPMFIPRTRLAQQKHADGAPLAYHPDSVNTMVEWAMKRLIAGMPDLTTEEMNLLASTSPHAFRHTFGTQATAEDVPLDVVQRVLGHASLQTTSIYVQAEKQRMMREVGDFYRKTSGAE